MVPVTTINLEGKAYIHVRICHAARLFPHSDKMFLKVPN